LAVLTVAPGRGWQPRQQVEMPLGDRQRQFQSGRVGMQRTQLQRQALAQAARRDAGRIQGLHQPEHAVDFGGVGGDLGQQRGGDVFQRVGDVTVVIDCIDNRAGDGEIARREIRVFELRDQVILQRYLRVVGNFSRALVVVAPGIGAGAALAPGVFDDFGFDGDFGLRLGIDALLFRHRMRFECFEGAGGLVFVDRLEHDIAFELFADVRLQLQCRHLQEANRLLQLRGHGELLTQLQLQ
jgi:hypothetical protein